MPGTVGDTNVIGYSVTVSDGRTITVTGRGAVDTQQAGKAMYRVTGGLTPNTGYSFTVRHGHRHRPGRPDHRHHHGLTRPS